MATYYHFYDKPQIADRYLNRFKRIATSALLFLIAFVAAAMAYNLLSSAVAAVLGYEIVFSFTRPEVLPHETKYWSLLRTIAIYVLPSFVLLVASVVIVILLRKYKEKITLLRMFWLWLSVCLFASFTTHLITSFIGLSAPRSAFYIAFAIPFVWQGISPAVTIVLSLAGIIGNIAGGYLIVNEFLRFSYSMSLLEARRGKIHFVIQFYLLPLVAAFPFVFLLTYSKVTVYYLSFYFSFLCIALGMFLRFYNASGAVRCNKKDVLNVVSPLIILIAAMLFLIVKFWLK